MKYLIIKGNLFQEHLKGDFDMKNIEQILTSMEVAEIVEKEHKMLLRDLRRYTNQLNQCKIAPVDFFEESTYKDTKGEIRPCYRITKKGCEFIAHKLTGTKGTIFTARYINRFHEMETRLETGINQELQMYLKDKLEKQETILRNIEQQTQRRGYISCRRVNSVQEQYRQEITQMTELSCDAEYLQAVYTFAKHYPNKSVVA